MPQFLTSLFSLSLFQVFQTLTLLTSVPCSVTSEFLAHALSLFQVVRTLSHFALNVMKGLMKPPLGQSRQADSRLVWVWAGIRVLTLYPGVVVIVVIGLP